MAKLESHPFLSFWAILLVLALAPAVAQSEDDPAEPAPASAERSAQSKDSPDFVYTTEYLKKRIAGTEGETAVYTNQDLDDGNEEARAPAAAFTNDDLKERFGDKDESASAPAAEDGAAAEEGATAGPGEAAPVEEPGEPAVSAAERDERIAEIDGELKRLERRMLAIRNPLLAGTVPPTEEEKSEEAGLGNEERLNRTEAKIEELRKALEELREQR